VQAGLSATRADNLIQILKICPKFGGLKGQKSIHGICCQVYVQRMLCIVMHPLCFFLYHKQTNKQTKRYAVQHTTALPPHTLLHVSVHMKHNQALPLTAVYKQHTIVQSVRSHYGWIFTEISIQYPVSSCLSYVQHYNTTPLNHYSTTALQQYSTTILQHCSTTPLQYYTTTLLQNYSTTALQHCSTAALQHCSTTPLKYHTTTALQHSNTTALQHYSTTTLQHYNTTALQHCSTTPLQHSNTTNYNTTALQHYTYTQHIQSSVLL